VDVVYCWASSHSMSTCICLKIAIEWIGMMRRLEGVVLKCAGDAGDDCTQSFVTCVFPVVWPRYWLKCISREFPMHFQCILLIFTLAIYCMKAIDLWILLYRNIWHCNNATGRALDLRSAGLGFKSNARQSCVTTLGKLFTPMCLLSRRSITWYQPRGGDAVLLGR